MDLAARLISDKLTPRMGNPVIVINQPGAGGTITAAATARGPKDGYMINFGASSALGYTKLINKDLSYDPQKDFTRVAMLGPVPVAFFVSASSPIRTLQDLVAAAKANPDKLNFGSPGVGTATHVAMEVFTDPVTRSELAKAGIEVAPLDRKAFGAKMATDLAVWESTLKVSGLTQQ